MRKIWRRRQAIERVKKEGENITLVVPDSKNVISSVTSESCLEIARSFGWKTESRSVSFCGSFLGRS